MPCTLTVLRACRDSAILVMKITINFVLCIGIYIFSSAYLKNSYVVSADDASKWNAKKPAIDALKASPMWDRCGPTTLLVLLMARFIIFTELLFLQ
jgi:hypothetical protein